MKIEENTLYAIMVSEREPYGLQKAYIRGEEIVFIRNKAGVHSWHCNYLKLNHSDIEGFILNGNYYRDEIDVLKKHYKEIEHKIYKG